MLTHVRAVIDIGTNSVLLLVASRRPDGSVEIVRDEARITRLGEGVAATRRFRPEAIARTLEALREYRALAEAENAELVAVATEGVRLASDADEFLAPAHAVLGTAVRLIDGDEEARLSYLSVADNIGEDVPLAVLDIGGGSTELVVGRGRHIEQRKSHRVGSVRATEEFIHHDPPRQHEIDAVAAAASLAFASQSIEPREELCGLAGTVTTVAALLLELPSYDRNRVDGASFSVGRVAELRDQLAQVPLGRRIRPCLPEHRADVIVAGTTILLAALQHCGANTLVVRDRGVRFGLV